MAKTRSPNYPAYDLGTTLGFARKLFKSEGKSNASPPAVAAALGYAGMSGAARTKIAAMRQYGLLEDAPEGRMRLASRAIRLVNLSPGEADYSKLAHEAALHAPLFREFQEKNPEASDRNLEIDLITVKHFSPDGARRVIKSYRDTLAFANLGAGGYTGAGGEANGGDDLDVGDPPDEESLGDKRRDRQQRPLEASLIYSWPLVDAEKVSVTFVGNPGKKPTRRDLDALIETLEGVRNRLPETRPKEDEDGE
jgi:hypothetical protein